MSLQMVRSRTGNDTEAAPRAATVQDTLRAGCSSGAGPDFVPERRVGGGSYGS